MTDDQKAKWVKAAVVYADILGTGKIYQNGDEDEIKDHRKKMEEIWEKSKSLSKHLIKKHNESLVHDYKCFRFSDSMCIAVFYTQEEEHSETPLLGAFLASSLQLFSLESSLALRGGISVGDVLIADDAIMGKAMLEVAKCDFGMAGLKLCNSVRTENFPDEYKQLVIKSQESEHGPLFVSEDILNPFFLYQLLHREACNDNPIYPSAKNAATCFVTKAMEGPSGAKYKDLYECIVKAEENPI